MSLDSSSSTDAAAGGTGRRAITAFFDDRATAQTAIDDVVAAGVDRSRVTLVEGGPEPVAQDADDSAHKSIWQSFKELFMADEDRHAYGEGLRRGGFLVSVDTSAGDHDRIVDLLDRDGAVDIDARQADWTLEGWDPDRAAADLAPGSGASAALPGSTSSDALRDQPSSPTPNAERIAASRVEPAMIEPSAAVGPAFGRDEPRTATGPTAIRDPGASSPRLRSYIDSHVRSDPDDAGR